MPFEWVVSQLVPQQPAHSQPSLSGAVAALQSARPGRHAYVHVPATHDGVPVVVSHALPQPPQFDGMASDDSHPLVSGGNVLQSAQPGAQPVYLHVVPAQLPPMLCVVSHVWPHTLHPAASTWVSQPFKSGAVVLQSA
jgi:hypothetical protein